MTKSCIVGLSLFLWHMSEYTTDARQQDKVKQLSFVISSSWMGEWTDDARDSDSMNKKLAQEWGVLRGLLKKIWTIEPIWNVLFRFLPDLDDLDCSERWRPHRFSMNWDPMMIISMNVSCWPLQRSECIFLKQQKFITNTFFYPLNEFKNQILIMSAWI